MDDLELSEIAPPRKSNRPSSLTLREPAPLKLREPDRPDDPEMPARTPAREPGSGAFWLNSNSTAS